MKKTFLVVAALNLPEGDLPEWYLIFKDGSGEVEGAGKYIVDEEAYRLARERIDRRGIDIVFDYEHQTVGGKQAPASGWCRDWRYTKGLGIEARVEWTEEAAGYLARGEYRYFSPVFNVRKSDNRLCSVHSVALTNAPRTNHLKPLLAKLGAEEEQDMDLKTILAKKLGLSETATDDQFVAKFEALLAGTEKPVVAKEILEVLGLGAGDDESTVVASIHALKQTEKTMVSKADFDLMVAKLAGRDADEAVAAAITAGKVTPDQREWATGYAKADLKGFQTFVAKAPVVINTGALPKDKADEKADLASPEVQHVASMMGVSSEDLKTFAG